LQIYNFLGRPNFYYVLKILDITIFLISWYFYININNNNNNLIIILKILDITIFLISWYFVGWPRIPLCQDPTVLLYLWSRPYAFAKERLADGHAEWVCKEIYKKGNEELRLVDSRLVITPVMAAIGGRKGDFHFKFLNSVIN